MKRILFLLLVVSFASCKEDEPQKFQLKFVATCDSCLVQVGNNNTSYFREETVVGQMTITWAGTEGDTVTAAAANITIDSMHIKGEYFIDGSFQRSAECFAPNGNDGYFAIRDTL